MSAARGSSQSRGDSRLTVKPHFPLIGFYRHGAHMCPDLLPRAGDVAGCECLLEPVHGAGSPCR